MGALQWLLDEARAINPAVIRVGVVEPYPGRYAAELHVWLPGEACIVRDAGAGTEREVRAALRAMPLASQVPA